MIKIISFDIGNTIYKIAKRHKLSQISIMLERDLEDVKDIYKKTFQVKNVTFKQNAKDFLRALNISTEEKNINSLEEILINNSNNLEYVSTSTEKILKDLKEKNYKIILLSNTHRKDNKAKLLKLIDKSYYSFEIGCLKTDKKTYKMIEKDLNVKKQEFLHIGDNYQTDYLYPIKNGWNAVLVNNKDHDCIVLEDLEELIKILNGIDKNSVELKDYTYLYKIIYQMEKDRLSFILDASMEVYHVGSTSVEGLCAKPIIDIAIVVNNLNDILPYVKTMEKQGYYFRDDNGVKGEYLFHRGDGDKRYCYVHVIEKDSTRYNNFMNFKKYLEEHKETITEYNNLKKELEKKYKTDRKKYTEGKNDFIQRILKEYKDNK